MLFWLIWALTPTKYREKRLIWVAFQGASDGNVKTSRNIARKSNNNEQLYFLKVGFSKIDEK